MINELQNVIPANLKGKPLDLEKTVIKKTFEEAFETYHGAYCKLRHPHLWKDFSGAVGTEFILVKGGGNPNLRALELGDFIKIDLSGPGPKSGEGFDWVKVELVEENVIPDCDASFAVRLRACSNPYHDQDEVAAHFFKDTATSTFVIQRKNLKITAMYAGRNEVPNLKQANIHDKLRNAVVSLAALAGFSELQWSDFIDSLLDSEIKKQD